MLRARRSLHGIAHVYRPAPYAIRRLCCPPKTRHALGHHSSRACGAPDCGAGWTDVGHRSGRTPYRLDAGQGAAAGRTEAVATSSNLKGYSMVTATARERRVQRVRALFVTLSSSQGSFRTPQCLNSRSIVFSRDTFSAKTALKRASDFSLTGSGLIAKLEF
jgi:hypothetical protein